MSEINFPPQDSPDIHLVVATAHEHLSLQHENSDEWRGALSLEAYLRREALLFQQEATKDGGLTPWALVYQPDPQGPRHMICGCESLNKKALAVIDGRVEEVASHTIASVFCPRKARGKGYAGRMMTEMGKRLRHWQTNQGKETLFSVLYSDIGKKFYAARGWQPFPSAHVSLSASLMPNPPHVRLLKDADLPELCELDEQLLRTRLSKLAKAEGSAVALIPNYRIMRWHHVREEFIANELYGKTPEIKGALIGEHRGSRVWAYWTRVWTNPQEESPNTLHILRLVTEDEAYTASFAPASPDGVAAAKGSEVSRAIAAIMSVAQAQAAEWDMKEVQIWNPTSVMVAAAQSIDESATVVHREDESITSMLWYGPGKWNEVDWLCNEKYGWS